MLGGEFRGLSRKNTIIIITAIITTVITTTVAITANMGAIIENLIKEGDYKWCLNYKFGNHTHTLTHTHTL